MSAQASELQAVRAAGIQRLDWSALSADARAAALQRPQQAAGAAVRAGVTEIFRAVASEGDAALRDLTLRFDRVQLDALELDAPAIAAGAARVPAPVQSAIAEAAARIEAFHRAGMPAGYALDTAPGLRCERVQRPIGRVGLYVPAGSAPLPSTALMLTIPARLAGCPEIVLCTPPQADGSADPSVLAVAARVPGVRVFTLGGAQAIAAMALGTASVPRCDKLFGPGNGWVDEAKRQAAEHIGGPAMDMPAGPSEVLVIADAGADAIFVAADLLSQAEHGADSQVLLLSPSLALLDAVEVELDRQLASLPRADIARRALAKSRLIAVPDLPAAFSISNDYAPEHLILALRDAEQWLDAVQCAGSVFVGDWTPEALGDYCSGSNHVLPTGGAARGWSGLSVASFQKAITVQRATAQGLQSAGPCAATLAHAEGLTAHARAIEVRLARAADEARA